MKRLFSLLFLASAALADPHTETLDNGLVYARVHTLPQDLPAAATLAHHAWIVDLRYVHAGAEESALVDSWLHFNCAPTFPVFVLVNPETSPGLVARVEALGLPGLVTVGPKRAQFDVDSAVVVSAAAERKAYEALERGATVVALITDFPSKPRIDEEKLTREHIRDSEAPDEPEEDPKHPTPPPPLIDATLQRAVHLDRGLIALKRL